MKKITGILLIVLSAVVSILFLYIASVRELTSLENTLFQIISLVLGLAGSYGLGKESAQAAAKEMIKPHARSAFRRLLSLYSSLSRLANIVNKSLIDVDPGSPEYHSLDKLESIILEQILTADDALEDWRDIIPEELDQLKKSTKIIYGKGDFNNVQ